jgi:hypothetical protein
MLPTTHQCPNGQLRVLQALREVDLGQLGDGRGDGRGDGVLLHSVHVVQLADRDALAVAPAGRDEASPSGWGVKQR